MWFRFYSDALNDPKVQALPPDLFKHWVNILCIASRNNGTLPETFHETAFHLRLSENEAITVVERLLNAGLIDRVSGGGSGYRYAPHSWNKRQYKSDTSTERVKRFRNVTRNVTETPPDTDTDTDIKKIAKAIKKRATRLPDDWDIPQEWGDWAYKEHHLTVEEINNEAEKFKDYWHGCGKAKVDWQATWRNWIRNYLERKKS